jgi:2-iminobutanoate/2-iminopropanoate deaminase
LGEMGLETRHIVKTTVFMTDLSEFDLMNQIYATYFMQPYPARSTVQVVALPKGAKIEIECLVIDTLAYEAHMHQHDHEGCGCGEGGCGEGEEGCGCGGDHEHTHGEETCEDGCCCG